MAEADQVLNQKGMERDSVEKQGKMLTKLLRNCRQQPASTGSLIAWLESVPVYSFPKTDTLYRCYLNELIVRFGEEEDDELLRISFALHPDYPPNQFDSFPHMRCQYAIDHGVEYRLKVEHSLGEMSEKRIMSIDKKVRNLAKEPLQRFTNALFIAWQANNHHSLGLLEYAQSIARNGFHLISYPDTDIADENDTSFYRSSEPRRKLRVNNTAQNFIPDSSFYFQTSANYYRERSKFPQEPILPIFSVCNKKPISMYKCDFLHGEELQNFGLLPDAIYSSIQIGGNQDLLFAFSRPFFYKFPGPTKLRAFIFYLQTNHNDKTNQNIVFKPLLLFDYEEKIYALTTGILNQDGKITLVYEWIDMTGFDMTVFDSIQTTFLEQWDDFTNLVVKLYK